MASPRPHHASPGAEIAYAIRAIKMTPTHGLFEGVARVDGTVIATGELGFAVARPEVSP